ncbi:L,D-transpeptidase family protein [Lentisalinibacter sediminis]|uniref:L,D-transpeptidase family protein n=1 Tax=Lentisalinibacter sediminis TaxID=2992237 RepID=UPI00386DEA40
MSCRDVPISFPVTPALLLALLLIGAAPGTGASPWDQELHGSAEQAVRERLRQRLEQIEAETLYVIEGEPLAARALLPDLYAARRFRPLWFEAERRRELLALVRASADEGLNPADYHLAVLERHAAEIGAEADPYGRADRDLLMTDALARLAHHLVYGKVEPSRLDPHWNFHPDTEEGDPVATLQAALAAESLDGFFNLERGAPYRQLVAALARYRGIADSGGWQAIPAGQTLKPGMRHPRVAAVRSRLAAEFPLPAAPDPWQYDDSVETTVAAFQRRYGLEPDGMVGALTLAAMNVPVAARIDQLRVNLDRARWVLERPEHDYLLVNIAGFRAFLMRGDDIRWETPVVVGQPYRRTPVFGSQIVYLVFNPTWTVPPVVLKNDVIPEAIADPAAVTRRGLQVVAADGSVIPPEAVDWARYRSGALPYQLVQPPGPDNALGRVKFILPNPYNVYLHDTPGRELFRSADRSFSSGCIRVERPLELAALLLDGDPDWGGREIEAAVATGLTRTVFLPRPAPVMILYWTAGMGPGGEFGFYPDVYERDAAVLRALDSDFDAPGGLDPGASGSLLP